MLNANAAPKYRCATWNQTARSPMMPKPSCRIYAIMAREAPLAVIFRRGPSRHVRLILWHTDRDAFEPGQWFRGRVYERRCDLSPDGRYLIYFAARHAGPLPSWTAISRPPYLTALVLWKKGDCWDGGGLFESESSIWLNHPESASRIEKGSIPAHFELTLNSRAVLGEDGPVQSRRLDRDGWKLSQALLAEPIEQAKQRAAATDSSGPVAGYGTIKPELRIKCGPMFDMEMQTRLSGFARTRSFTCITRSSQRIPLPEAQWADFDQAGRLVFASGGCLFAAEIDAGGVLQKKPLADFNSDRYERIGAPEWARSW